MAGTTKIAHQVMWNRLISVVEEQAQALVRTAFSTSVREAGDLSAGVYNDKGEMLAQAVTGTPGHVNAMADSVPHFIRRIGAIEKVGGWQHTHITVDLAMLDELFVNLGIEHMRNTFTVGRWTPQLFG